MSGLGLFRLHSGFRRNSSSSSDDESQNRSPPGSNPNRVKRNFDFDTGVPMHGRFSWEETPAGEVPRLYRPPVPHFSEAESSECKENRVSTSSSASTTPPSLIQGSSSSTTSSSLTRSSGSLADSPICSVHDLRTPAPPPTAVPTPPPLPTLSSSTLEHLSSSSSSDHLGARTKDNTKERKITEAQFQFRARKSRSKSSSKLRLKRLGADSGASSRSPSVKSRVPRDSEEPPLAPLPRSQFATIETTRSRGHAQRDQGSDNSSDE